MRDKFEEWAKDFVKGRDSNDRYASPYTQAAWEGWQAAFASGDPLRWPIQPEGIGLILTEALNIPEISAKIAKAIQSGNY